VTDRLSVCYVCGIRGVGARKTLLDKLQGYDYDPSAQPDEDYPDDSISQIGDSERVRYHAAPNTMRMTPPAW
jgi:hypothetical protein